MSLTSKEFKERSSVNVLVPQATDLDLEELFANNEKQDGLNQLFTIEQRSHLFFDESIWVYTILQTPYQSEVYFKSYIARLAMTLEVHAYGSEARIPGLRETSRESSPSRHEDTLWSGDVDTSEEPLIVIQEGNDVDSVTYVLAIWKTRALLSRPRIRLQSPTIVFRPSANLRPDKERLNEALEDHHLPSGVPAPVNLLESLKGDPAAEGVNPSLLASRLSGTISKTNGEEFSDNFLRVGAQKPFSALPAISSRIRYSRAICPPGRLSVIAALEIEIAPFSENLIEIAAVDMQLSEGYAENIGKAHGVSLPLIYRSKDNPVFLFRLTPNEAPQGGSNPSSTKTTLISVLATVLLAHTCHPSIEMRWRTGVDFSTAPVYGAFGQSMQTYTRPSSLARTPSTANVDILPTPARHEETSSTSADNISRSRPAYVSDFGIAITFTSPKTVRVGEPFSWNILVLNRSNKPRQLDLSVLPKRRSGGHSSNPSSSSVGGRKESDSADVVIEESLLYAMQRNSGHDTPQVISLSTDVRVRALLPDACFNTELMFLPLAAGRLQVEAIRIIDVESKESTDIRDVPDIVAEGPGN